MQGGKRGPTSGSPALCVNVSHDNKRGLSLGSSIYEICSKGEHVVLSRDAISSSLLFLGLTFISARSDVLLGKT